MPQFLNKSANDSVAILTTTTPNFILPIIISSGVGVTQFINFNIVDNVVNKTSYNNNLITYIKQSFITGSFYLHPQSGVLSDIQAIQLYQSNNRLPVIFTLSIFNFGMLKFEKCTNFRITSTYQGVSRNSIAEDIQFDFMCSSPKSLDLSIAEKIYNAI